MSASKRIGIIVGVIAGHFFGLLPYSTPRSGDKRSSLARPVRGPEPAGGARGARLRLGLGAHRRQNRSPSGGHLFARALHVVRRNPIPALAPRLKPGRQSAATMATAPHANTVGSLKA